MVKYSSHNISRESSSPFVYLQSLLFSTLGLPSIRHFYFCIFDTNLFCDCSIPGVIMQAGKLRNALWPASVPVILLCEVWSHNPCLFKKIISSSAVFQGSISDGLYNVLKLIRTSVQPWPWYHPFHTFRYSSHFEKNVLLSEILILELSTVTEKFISYPFYSSVSQDLGLTAIRPP